MISTESQAKYLACRLTRQSRFGEMEKLIPVYLKSGIEVYPHQIAAAYFAVSNPFSKGFILCDEVGLGKAIEAMLVIAQYYYSGRNKIAVIVPPLLIPQWQRLISDKFDLSCKVVEKGIEIDDNDEIILISYTQAAEEWESLSKIKWNLAVFEEAHRLRKYYTGENRTATNLHNAFDGVQKLLLTATPMQVNVMDLYGLVNFIDDTVFTDERAFYKRYYKKAENYKELRERLMPFTFRTLRNQVRGDVKLPDRIIHTQEYALNENEKNLLELLSKYVDKPKKLAFPDMDTYELGLMLFKLFSSSIYALSKTLSGVFFRLNQMGNAEAIEEAKEIKVMLDLATSIVDTSKWATFLRGLEQGFAAMEEKGQPQKVVVFTENRQTQEYIFKQLGKYTKYKTTLFEDESSIEAWQKRGNILIATDSACESFNMQFCSFIINYELPWNVQKIEQRIGRCQRIGQDNDVYVLNFLNRENYADVRFYELVFKRTTMFDGILGASDGVISDVASGKIEETMAKGFAAVRSKEEIEKEFDDIRAEYDKEVTERKKQSDELLFNTFAGKIVEKTKNYANLLKAECAKFKADLWDFCEYTFKRYGSIINPEDAFQALNFTTETEQYIWLSREIKRNIEEEELDPDDILVVFPDAYYAQSSYNILKRFLAQQSIESILSGVTTDRDTIKIEGAISCASIFRAKGNEFPFVYVVNAHECYKSSNIALWRNILFTAITRARAWVRVCGVGTQMEELKKEITICIDKDYKLEFKNPTDKELNEMRSLFRSLSRETSELINSSEQQLMKLADLLKKGEINKEDLQRISELFNSLDTKL